MAQQLTSPSNCSSINQNLLRLNSSSSCCLVSPSQSNFNSHLKNNLVHFQQYTCKQQDMPTASANIIQINSKKVFPPSISGVGLGKKKLTIKIDQNYDTPNPSIETEKILQKYQKPKPKLSQNFEQPSSSIDCIQLISPIQNNKITLKSYQQQKNQENYKHNQQFQRVQQLHVQCQKKQEKIKMLEDKIQYFKSQLEGQISQNQIKANRIQILEEKIRQKQNQLEKAKLECIQRQRQKQKFRQKLQEKTEISQSILIQIQEKIKQKDSKIKQLAKINEKLKNLNKDLLRQVKNNQKKVRDLEKQLQNNLCQATQQNLHRLKESSLKQKQKQNIQRYNGNYTGHTTKTDRDMVVQMATTKQKETSFAGSNSNMVMRKSLERKKSTNTHSSNTNTVSAGQLSQPKKHQSSKIGVSSSSNTILNKKLMHK